MNHALDSIDEIFWEAARLPPGDSRSAYLNGACGQDGDMRQHIDRLLRVQGKVNAFLEVPFAGPVANALLPEPCEGPGDIIGPYKLMEQIGEGGMGLVFVAEQQHPIKRLVALKVIKPGMDSKQVIARFEAERQALALMDHPNIARIIDAGFVVPPLGGSSATGESRLKAVLRTGRPYFVMELVRGIPITDYCDQARFTIRQRLAIFVDVCRAVQHAHTKGIIHRDLKPSNVLVTSHDGAPVPKVIDFGVAKALTQPLTDKTVYTCFAQLIGTPLYLSPEQAEFNDKGVDTQSDVYSLGVLLYELLAGTTPFDGDRLKTVGFDEFRRIIREEEPPRPSTRLSTIGNALSTVSERRQVDPRRITTELRGELDWIVMKAVEKDRTRRYESAGAFARDVERYLKHEPVEACPPTAGYRAVKFVRRNGRLVAGAGVIAVTLVVATGVSAWQAVKAREALKVAEGERDRAETAENKVKTEAAVAIAFKDFLQTDLLRQLRVVDRPDGLSIDNDLSLREALQRAEQKVEPRFRDQPLAGAEIRLTIGQLYCGLNDFGRGLVHLERALTLRKVHLGAAHKLTLDAVTNLGNSYWGAGRPRDAIALFAEYLDAFKLTFGADNPITANLMAQYGRAHYLVGEYDEAERLQRAGLEIHRRRDPVGRGDTANHLIILGRTLFKQKRYLESEGAAREAQAILSEDATAGVGSCMARSVLGSALCGQRRYEEAEPLLLQGYSGLKQREATASGFNKWRLVETIERLIEFYDETDQSEIATKWRKELEATKQSH